MPRPALTCILTGVLTRMVVGIEAVFDRAAHP